MVSGLLAVLGFAGGVLTSKFELSKRKVPISVHAPLLFLLLCFVTGMIMIATGQKVMLPDVVFGPSYIIAFIIMICVAVAWNVFYYQALSKENIQEFDLIIVTEPLVTIALAGVYLSSERNPTVLLLALIAAIALIFAHMRHHKVRIDRYAKELIVAVFLMGVEVLIIKYLLGAFSPISLYFWRTLFVFGALYAMYRPDFKKVALRDFTIIFIDALFGVLQMVARYYGYNIGGVVVTTLALLLGPVIVEVYSLSVMKEKVSSKSVLAFVVVCLCVLISIFLGFHK